MADKPVIKIGHLKITDHLILGVTELKLKKGMEKFNHCSLQSVLKNGWNDPKMVNSCILNPKRRFSHRGYTNETAYFYHIRKNSMGTTA